MRECLQINVQSIFAFFCAVIFPLFSFADASLLSTSESDPSAFIEGKVNALTGKIVLEEDDLTIQGVEPIRITRRYIDGFNGEWQIVGDLARISDTEKKDQWVVQEKDRASILYQKIDTIKIGKRNYIRCQPSDLEKGFSNTARGEISSRTNLKNNRVLIHDEFKKFIVHSADGIIRKYKETKPKSREYYLTSEQLPNGNWVLYEYDEVKVENEATQLKLRSIRTTNPSKSKTYAKADFVYESSKRTNKHFWVKGSDGQAVEYRFRCDHKGRQAKNLEHVISSSAPDQIFRYMKYSGKYEKFHDRYNGPEQRRLQAFVLPLDRQIQFDYYKKEYESIPNHNVHLDEDEWIQGRMIDDPRRGRVKQISFPLGNDSTPQITYSFLYEPEFYGNYFQKVTVFDIEGNWNEYVPDNYARLRFVHRYSKENKRMNSQQFQWGYQDLTGCLISKTLYDSNLEPTSFVHYTYDARWNVIEEKFCGNLTGSGPPIQMDANRFPIPKNLEICSKKFCYSAEEPNLLLEEKYESGLRVLYTYLPGTDLPVSKLTYDQNELILRQFFEYNEDRILTRVIEDDGTTLDPNNYSGVTVRAIRQFTLIEWGPYVGLPQAIEEKYWENGKEIRLIKTLLTYTIGAKISRQDIFDAEGKYRFSLETLYDEKGRPTSKTNPLGQTETFAYDLCGNPITKTDFSQRVTTSVNYDYSNLPTSILKRGDDGLSHQIQYSYNRTRNLISETDPHGEKTIHHYDSLGRRVETHLPKISNELGELLTPTTQIEYDAAGNEISKKDPDGHTTKITYNAYGKPLLIIHPDGAKEEYSYYLNGPVKTHTNPNCVTTHYTYDALERLLRKSIFSSANTLLAEETFLYKGKCLISKTDAEGFSTHYQYDGAGRKISEERSGEKIHYFYDALGRVNKIQREDTVHLTEYDLLDRPIEEKTQTIQGKRLRWTQYEYDEAGNQKTIIHSINGEKTYERKNYDSFSRLIEKINPIGHKETIHYTDFYQNTHGQKVLQKTHIDPMGLQTIETYNTQGEIAKVEIYKEKTLSTAEKFYTKNGLLTHEIDTLFTPTTRQVHTKWLYDTRGRLKTLIEANGTLENKTTHYTYTPTGELAQITKPNQIQLFYEYNELGHLISLHSSDKTVQHHMRYNRLGHLLQSDSLNRTLDSNGRILSEIFPAGYSIHHQYDSSARRIETKIPSAQCTIAYTYEGTNLKTVSRKTPEKTLYTHEYLSRDLAGNLVCSNLIANLGQIHYQTDLLSRKIQLQAPHFFQRVEQFDPVGNICQMQIQNESLFYTYDELYQLTSESGPTPHDYLYDPLNNRLQKDGEHYQINALNQDLSHFTYDPNGNPTNQADHQYSFDAMGRLIRIDTPQFSRTYTYDSLHRCLKTTTQHNDHEETRYFLYDGNNEIGALDENLTLIEFRVLGETPHAEIGAAIAIELDNQIYAPIHDLQGNIAALIPIDGSPPSLYRYTAFGEELLFGPVISPWRFSSKRSDSTTHLVYYGRRFYSPQFGRWLSPDPAGFLDGMNLYAFVHNDPLTHIDEYGLFTPLHYDYMSYSYYAWSKSHWNKPAPIRFGKGLNAYNSPVYYINGIKNTLDDSDSGTRTLFRTLGGKANVIPIYSCSFGTCKDLHSVRKVRHDPNYSSFAISRLNREIRWSILALDAMNDPRKIFINAFSRGGGETYHACKNLTPEQRDRLIITACGSIMTLPRNLGFSVLNLISEGDRCSRYFHRGLKKNPDKFEDFANVRLLPRQDGYWKITGDHFYKSKTYQSGTAEFMGPLYYQFGLTK